MNQLSFIFNNYLFTQPSLFVNLSKNLDKWSISFQFVSVLNYVL